MEEYGRDKHELVPLLDCEGSSKCKIVNFERELIPFNLCELNFDLPPVKCELAQHCSNVIS